jgi:hypothetical protein
MSFNIGDVVRIGKGKVEYTVDNVQPENYGQVLIKSNNTGKTQLVETDRLTLVHSDFLSDAEIETEIAEQADTRDDDVDFSKMPALIPVPETEIMAPWEIELLHGGVNPGRPFLLTVDGVTSDHKSYGAACDALIIATRNGIQYYAVIDHAGQRKATRTAV